MRFVWALLLVGCGRLGFETPTDGTSMLDDSGGSGSDALIDGPPNNPDAMDTTVTFGENTANDVRNVTRDTYLSLESALANYGSSDDIRVERDSGRRVLIAFDVSSLPLTAVVLSAQLQLDLEDGIANATVTFHEILEAWDEGNDDGVMGIANYMFREQGIPWSVAGASAFPSIGAPLGTFPATTSGLVTVDLPASLVQRWVSGPNHGILFATNVDDTVRFASSEGPNNTRPVLTVTYE